MNRHSVKLGLAFVCSLLLTSVWPTQAMNFSESLLNDDVLIIKLQGKIVKGDMARLQNFVGRANRDKKRKTVVLIDSPGGLVAEAADMASFISENKLPVAVHRQCASSCFLIFAASSVKLVAPDSYIGVHSARSINSGENGEGMAVSVLMGRELRRYGVPASVIGQLVTTNPDDMYRLSSADLTAMGANIAR